MFKKFFNWIKSIHEKIFNAKVEEFRRRRNIYDIPDDFHTNPKYNVFKEICNTKHRKLNIIDWTVLIILIVSAMDISGVSIWMLSKIIMN